MLGAPAGASAQGVDTACQFALTRLDATTPNALALATNAVCWGGTYAALAGTRIRIEGQYLPDPSFAQAIQNVPEPGAEAETMADYYPSGEYLAGPGEFRARGCPRG